MSNRPIYKPSKKAKAIEDIDDFTLYLEPKRGEWRYVICDGGMRVVDHQEFTERNAAERVGKGALRHVAAEYRVTGDLPETPEHHVIRGLNRDVTAFLATATLEQASTDRIAAYLAGRQWQVDDVPRLLDYLGYEEIPTPVGLRWKVKGVAPNPKSPSAMSRLKRSLMR